MTSMTFCEKHQYWHPHLFECAHCANEKELTDIATLRADLAAARALLRCNVTNKLCGTDTWFVGYSCPCASCEAWLAARKGE